LTDDLDAAALLDRIQKSFAKQGLMATLGASLVNVAPGLVEIAIRPVPAISQQHGFVHAFSSLLAARW
jgi:acyl-coenzyme A thioesterase PaaI-like protein